MAFPAQLDGAANCKTTNSNRLGFWRICSRSYNPVLPKLPQRSLKALVRSLHLGVGFVGALADRHGFASPWHVAHEQ